MQFKEVLEQLNSALQKNNISVFNGIHICGTTETPTEYYLFSNEVKIDVRTIFGNIDHRFECEEIDVGCEETDEAILLRLETGNLAPETDIPDITIEKIQEVVQAFKQRDQSLRESLNMFREKLGGCSDFDSLLIEIAEMGSAPFEVGRHPFLVITANDAQIMELLADGLDRLDLSYMKEEQTILLSPYIDIIGALFDMTDIDIEKKIESFQEAIDQWSFSRLQHSS